MDVLVYLASEPGKVISKEELLGAVWGGAFVEEGALSQAVHSLRKALGDSARHPRYVQTIPKRGYRLLAPVVPDQAQVVERSIDDVPAPLREPASWAPPPVSLRSRRSCLFLAAATAFVAVTVLWLGWAVFRSVSSKEVKWALREKPKIAVLPFENLGKPEGSYFADGLTEKITRGLASGPLQVIDFPSDLLQNGKPLSENALTLGADYVLRGTIRRIAGPTHVPRVHVTSLLIRVADGAPIRSDAFEADVLDVIGVQKQISHRVIVGTTSGPSESLMSWWRPAGSDLRAAEALLRRASGRYPRGGAVSTIAELYRASRRYEQAERFLARASSVEPNVPFFWKQRALNQRAWMGDPEKVRAMLGESPVLKSPELQAIAFQLDLDERQYRQALGRLSPEWVRHLSLQEQSWIAIMAALARGRLGDDKAALVTAAANRAAIEGYLKRLPKDPMLRAYLAMSHAQLGQRAEALSQAERAVRDSQRDAFSGPRTIEVQAMVDTILGRRREAVTRLAHLLAISYQDSISTAELRIDPIWDPLRNFPEFEGLLLRFEPRSNFGVEAERPRRPSLYSRTPGNLPPP